MSRLDSMSKVSGDAAEELGLEQISPEAYKLLNQQYRQVTQELFEQADTAAIRSKQMN